MLLIIQISYTNESRDDRCPRSTEPLKRQRSFESRWKIKKSKERKDRARKRGRAGTKRNKSNKNAKNKTTTKKKKRKKGRRTRRDRKTRLNPLLDAASRLLLQAGMAKSKDHRPSSSGRLWWSLLKKEKRLEAARETMIVSHEPN